MQYYKTKGPRGRSLIFREGKMVSIKNVPQNVLDNPMFEAGEKVEDSTIAPTPPEKRFCIFCGQPGTEQKLINGQAIDMCLDHYHNRTTGEVVQQLRERETVNG